MIHSCGMKPGPGGKAEVHAGGRTLARDKDDMRQWGRESNQDNQAGDT